MAFHRDRRQGSRDRLLAAAVERFCADGYFAVSVEDITAAAGLSRMTFYRHFTGKAALATEMFREACRAAMPRFLAVGDQTFRDRATIVQWIAALFAADRDNRRLLRVFTQATLDDAEFTADAQALLTDFIAGLGRTIPAFALDPDDPAERRRWLEGWLILYEILDQSNHAALTSGIATDPLVIEILSDRFVAFVA